MAKVTITLDDELLGAARGDAQRLGTSLDELIGELLEQRVPMSKQAKLARLLALLDRAPGH